MAHKKCAECGTLVPENVALCPQCGHPVNVEHESGLKQGFRVGWMAIVVLVIVLALFALIGTCRWHPV